MIPHKLLGSNRCPNILTHKDLVYIGILQAAPVGGKSAALARIKDGSFSDILANMRGVRTPFDRQTSLRPYIAANHNTFLAIPNTGFSASSSGGSATALQMYTTPDYGDTWELVSEVSGQPGLAAATLKRIVYMLQVAWNEDRSKGVFYTLGQFRRSDNQATSGIESCIMLSLDGKNWTVTNGNYHSVTALYNADKIAVLYTTVSGGMGAVFYSVTEDTITNSKAASLAIPSGIPTVASHVPLGAGLLCIPTSGSGVYVAVDWEQETISLSPISVPASLTYQGGDYAGHSYSSFLRTADINKVGVIYPSVSGGKEFLVSLADSTISVEEKAFKTSYAIQHTNQGGAIVGGSFWQAYPNMVCLEDLSDGLYPPKCMMQKLPVPDTYDLPVYWAAMVKK